MSSNTSKTILLLAANPKGTTPLRLDEEVREIDAGLQRAKHREQFVLEQKWAVRARDIQRGMLDSKPSIVHFCGHGTGDEGLVFEDETGIASLVDGEALAGLFELFAAQVECVVLNGCYSEVQASAIAQHVNYVIGMNKAIRDRAAIEFAVTFYDALGAGRPVEFAHQFGCGAIRLAGIPEQLTPVLKKKPGIGETVPKISWPLNQPSRDYAPELDKRCRPHLKPTNDSWRVDEMYILVKGEWKYLYQAVDSQGNTLDFMLSAKRDARAAERFLRKALKASHNQMPRVINVDKNAAYPPAIDKLQADQTLPETTELPPVKYLNNIVKQGHRFIKRLVNSGIGFGSFNTARRTLRS